MFIFKDNLRESVHVQMCVLQPSARLRPPGAFAEMCVFLLRVRGTRSILKLVLQHKERCAS